MFDHYKKVLEIGPGMGVLTQFLVPKTKNLHLIEIDSESVNYLRNNYSEIDTKITEGDFLKIKLKKYLEIIPLPSLAIFHIIFRHKLFLRHWNTENKYPFLLVCFKKK